MHPYRLSPEPEPTDDRGKAARAAAYRASLVRMIVAGGALAVVLASAPFVVRLLARRAPTAPPELLTAGATFPVPTADLAPSVPLAPLLAADAPEGLAVLDSADTALNLRPGEPVTMRFNRPMVDGARVGKPVDAPVVELRPGVRGRTVWTSRSALSFEPAPSEWLRTHVVSMTLAPGVRSLAGEEAPEVDPRTVVFDAGPRLVRGPRAPRLVAGEAAAFEFSGNVEVGALRGQLLAYEVDGGRRTLPLRLTGHPRDAQGDTRVDVAFERLLEPGAQLAVALAPTLTNGGGDRPRVFDLELAPRAKIEGIGCPADATQAAQCEYQGPPGQVVDVEESLRLLSSVKVAPPPPDAVTVTPPLPHATLTVEAETRLVLRGEWAPGQVYEVRLNGLADEDGHPLARTAPLAVRSSGQPPAVHAPAGRLAFESDAPAELRMRGIHVDRGEVRLARVPEGDELAAVLSPGSWLEATGRDARATPLLDVLPSARPNRWGSGILPWGDGARASMVVLGLSADTGAEPPTQPSLTFAQQTDLGVDVKLLPRGARVWVTSVASAQPVPAARVTLADPNGAIVGDATTDAQGVAWVGSATSLVESVSAVRVVAGSDRAVVVVDSRSAIGPRHLGLSPGEQPPPAGAWVASVFTDRGIVRPGDTVHARAVVRVPEQDALHVPEEASAELLLFGPTGEMPLDRRTAMLSAFGGIDADFRVDVAAGPGTFRVAVRREGETRAAGTASFVVAHYEPPALRVDLAPSATQLDDRDPLRMDVSASFTFGPAAVGMPGSWTLTREPDGDYPEQWARYAFTPVDARPARGTMAAGQVLLDDAGRASVTTPIAAGGPGRERDVFEIEVRDPSGRTTSARKTVTTYPARYEVGVRRSDAWLDAGASLDVEALVIAHDGTPAEGRRVRARIVREGWHSYWEWSRGAEPEEDGADGGAYRSRRSRQLDVVHTCELVSGGAPVHCAWSATRPGTYVLEASTRDEAGRTSVASQRLYVAGPDEHPDRDPPGTAVELTPTRRSWTVGETAEVAFESPFPDAEALLEVDRDGVVVSESRRATAGGNVFRFPVTREMVPNAFVTLSLARPRTGPPGRKVDLDAPDLRVGIVELSVGEAAAPLVVRVEAAEKAPAGTDVPVEVHVTDGEGRPVSAEVTLFAVDEATLRMTGYEAPDPLDGLLPRLAPAFAWEDLRRALVSRIAEPLADEAGGDGEASTVATTRKRDLQGFDPTPLWMPHETTDATGRAGAVLHLPSRAAEYRIMAVATDAGNRAGHAQTATHATLPLVVRPTLPVFATVGDRFEATAFVHNTDATPRDVSVTTFVGDDARPPVQAHLEAGGELRVAEWVDVGPGDELPVRFEARSDDVSAGLAVAGGSVEVRPRARQGRSEVVGAVTTSHEIAVQLPPEAQGGVLTLSLARHPFVGMDTALEELLASPGSGVEPLASSLLGLAATSGLDTGKRPSSVAPGELAARASTAIARLSVLQTSSGGFGMYSAQDEQDPFLSAYALHALCVARGAGFVVDDARVERARTFLVQLTRGSEVLDKDGNGRDDLAFALRAMSEAGTRDDERITAVFDQRELLTPYGLAQLSLAMSSWDFRRETLVVEALRRVLATRQDERDDARVLRWYDTSPRTLGAVLEAASASPATAGSVDTRRLASAVLQTRETSSTAWRSTLETSQALAALAAFAATFPSDQPLASQLALDGVPVPALEQHGASAWYRIPLVTPGPHTLRIGVDGTAWFALAGRWMEPLGAVDGTPRGQGATLHRILEDATGKPLGPDPHVRLGDLVRVRLFLYTESSPAPPYLELRDPLAGGLEPVDAAHETSPRGSLWALMGMGPDDDAIDARAFHAGRSLEDVAYRAFLPTETLFDLVRPPPGLREYTYGVRAMATGTFTLPPAELRALYAPGFEARSAIASVTVEP